MVRKNVYGNMRDLFLQAFRAWNLLIDELSKRDGVEKRNTVKKVENVRSCS